MLPPMWTNFIALAPATSIDSLRLTTEGGNLPRQPADTVAVETRRQQTMLPLLDMGRQEDHARWLSPIQQAHGPLFIPIAHGLWPVVVVIVVKTDNKPEMLPGPPRDFI